jgi:hypothetical protein
MRPWTTHPLVDASLGWHAPWTTRPYRCVSTWTAWRSLSWQSSLGLTRHIVLVCNVYRLRLYRPNTNPTYPDIRSVCLKRSGYVGLGCVDQWTHRPRDALSKRRNIRDFSFGDTKKWWFKNVLSIVVYDVLSNTLFVEQTLPKKFRTQQGSGP